MYGLIIRSSGKHIINFTGNIIIINCMFIILWQGIFLLNIRLYILTTPLIPYLVWVTSQPLADFMKVAIASYSMSWAGGLPIIV